jgi:hypothetical protein
MSNKNSAVARMRRRAVIKSYVRGSLIMAGSFAGLAVVLVLLR